MGRPTITVLLSAGTAWIGRVLAIVISLAGMAIAYRSLGEEEFGLLLIALSIGSWVGMVNLTFGRVLTTIVAKRQRSSPRFVRAAVAASVRLSAITNLLLVGFWSACLVLGLATLPLTAAIMRHQADFTAAIITVFAGMSLWSFLSVFEAIEAGHETVFRVSMWQNLSYLASLGLLFTVFAWQPSIALAAYILCLSFLAGSVLHAAGACLRYRPLLTGRSPVRRRLAPALIRNTLAFTRIYFCTSLLYQVSVGVLGLLLPPQEVIETGLVMRIAQALLSITFGLLYPMASSITARLAASDRAGAVQTARWSFGVIAAMGLVAGTGMLFFGRDIFLLWLGRAAAYDDPFRVAAALLFLLLPVHAYLLWLMVGLERVRDAARAHLWQAAAFVVLAPLLYRLAGQTGVITAIDACLVLGLVAMGSLLAADERARRFIKAGLPVRGRRLQPRPLGQALAARVFRP